MKKLTIIIPFLNEGQEPIRTIESIYNTCDSQLIDIIAIDDCSDHKLTDFSAYPEVKVLRNSNRIGVAVSRQIGAEMAQTPYLLIIDGHMRFRKDNWYTRITEALEKEPHTLFCTTCVHLTPDQMDMERASGKYYGADLVLVDPSQSDSIIASQIIEPKWAIEKEGNEYEIPCILGANYAVSKDWFLKLKGLKGLQKWGGDEAFLSLKSWLAGGKCKLIKDIEIGHMFRENAPYVTKMYHMYYNKMWICWTLFPDELSQYLIQLLPDNPQKHVAQTHISSHWSTILSMREYFQSIFTRPLKEILEHNNIAWPLAIIS